MLFSKTHASDLESQIISVVADGGTVLLCYFFYDKLLLAAADAKFRREMIVLVIIGRGSNSEVTINVVWPLLVTYTYIQWSNDLCRVTKAKMRLISRIDISSFIEHQ